jgi:opacity protein-like surface antigen
MKIITLLLPAAALLISLSTTAHATKFSYTYLEASYSNQDSNGIDGIFNKHGSVALDDNMHFIFKDSTVWLKPNAINDDQISEGSVGLGYHTPISNKTDLTASASLLLRVKTSTDQSTNTKAKLGYGVALGVRHQLTDDLEANIKATHNDVNNADFLTNTSLSIGGRYNLTNELSAGVNVSTAIKDRNNQSELLTASLRWSSL